MIRAAIMIVAGILLLGIFQPRYDIFGWTLAIWLIANGAGLTLVIGGIYVGVNDLKGKC